MESWCDPYVALQSRRFIAVIKSINGEHHSALKDLESLFPVAKALSKTKPVAFYDYLNSFAVEKGEVGRTEEAERISRFVLASPLAPAYPEWRETLVEIEQKKPHAARSIIAITLVSPPERGHNVVQLPVTISPTLLEREIPEHPADVVNLEAKRIEMAKQRERKHLEPVKQPEKNEEFRQARKDLVEFMFDEEAALTKEDIDNAMKQMKESVRNRQNSQRDQS